MKKEKIFTWAEHLLIAFYIAIFSIPALVQEGYNLGQTFLLLFKTIPSNYLLYITPVFLYLFIKKSDIQKHEKIISAICINLFTIFYIYSEFESNSGKVFYTIVAIFILSLICINTNDLTASLILLPGIFITKLGLFYLFTAYFPVLFLLMIKTGKEQPETQKKKSSFMILFAYLYIMALSILLFFKKKFVIDITAIRPNLTHPDDYINIVSGIILLVLFFILFVYRAYPVLKNGTMPEKTAIVLSSVYPLVYCAFGTFFSLVSYNFKSVFTLSFLMYALNNLQLSITYNDKVRNIIPDKFKKTNVIIYIIILFCAFFFKSRI